MTLEVCPRCSNKLGPPLRSGRQVCMKCAWSSQPKDAENGSSTAATYRQRSHQQSDPGTRQIMSILVHVSLFFSGVGIVVPIVFWFASKDSVVRNNSKEVLNLQISLLLYAIALFFLMILIQGPAILLFFLLVLVSFILPILAILHCISDPDTPYTYPFIVHVFR